jgi:hypothetical protein
MENRGRLRSRGTTPPSGPLQQTSRTSH